MTDAQRIDLVLRSHAEEHRAMHERGLAHITMDRRQQLQMRNQMQQWFAKDVGVGPGTAGLTDVGQWPTWAKALGVVAVIGIPLGVLLYLES